MVGIVIVSHSQKLAEGVAELDLGDVLAQIDRDDGADLDIVDRLATIGEIGADRAGHRR